MNTTFKKIDTKDADNEEMKQFEEGTDESSKPPPFLFSKRFWVTIQILLGFFNMYGLRANISIAVVEMTSSKTIFIENQTIYQPAEFHWEPQTKGFVFSIFAYGYLVAIFGGYITSKFGGATTFGVSIFLVGLLSVATPVILYLNFYIFLISRTIVGALEGFAYSSSADIFSRWAPPQERSTMVAHSINGFYLGTAIVYPVCGFIAHKWGWTRIFYFTGVMGCITSVIWLISVKNRPSEDKCMSRKERQYLVKETKTSMESEGNPPWKSILTSKCIWALCVTKFAYGVGFNLLVTSFPLYVKDMTNESTDNIGLLSAIPNIICTLLLPIIGKLLDYLQNNCNMTTTTLHKLIMTFGYLSSSLLFILVVYITDFTICMVCFVLIKVFLAFNFLVTHIIVLYVAPKYTSTVLGSTAVSYTIGLIFAPTIVGYIVQNQRVEEWNRCFLCASFILTTSAIIFLICGSSEPQPWATSSSYMDQRDENELKAENEKCLE